MKQKLNPKIIPITNYFLILLIVGFVYGCSKSDEDNDEIFVPTLYMHGMAQTEGNGVISFGGINYNKMDNITYRYNSEINEWKTLSISTKPHSRAQFGMSYSGNSIIVLFGGWYNDDAYNYQNGYVLYNDTWEFDISTETWEEIIIDSGQVPGKRRWTAMAYAGNSKTVLFGGDKYYTSSGSDINTVLANDTWIYDATSNQWEQVISGQFEEWPSVRAYHVMAHAGENKVLLYGGTYWETENPFNYSDTWEFNVETKKWSKIEFGGEFPSGRNLAAMAYAGDNVIVLFGGNLNANNNDGFTNETWEYNALNKTWTKINVNGALPPSTIHHGIAYGGNSKIYLHGGVGTASTGSIWEYNKNTKLWKELLRQTGM
ncbi:MAG: hypothetical protein KAT68_02645 [Bacteroidales bacterium]|nr:hypothetical protein [Bacteroidales bacterium]